MTVSASYRAYVLDQLSAIAPTTAKAMFGGVGLYANGLFFALMDDDQLYFKVDDSNRGDFEAKGMGAFHPFGDERAMGYFEVPEDVLEDVEELARWMAKALKVAASKPRKKKVVVPHRNSSNEGRVDDPADEDGKTPRSPLRK